MKTLSQRAARRFEKTMLELLEMEPVEVTPDRMVLRMPVTDRVKQPARLLHGGATAALIETTASMGSAIQCPAGMMPVGIELNCNHIRSKKDGYIEAVGLPLHRGKRTHVWDVRVVDEKGNLVAVGRCTIAIVPLKVNEE